MNDLRVTRWEDYIGQVELKARLQTHIRAALKRGDRLDHVFLGAAPGTGKTTLAQLIATELGVKFMSRVVPVKLPLLKSILREFEGVLLLDEFHRMKKEQQESLLMFMEDHIYETDLGYIENDDITIVGATTEPQNVIIPLRDRFPITPEFVTYTPQEMAKIVQQMARKLNVNLSEKNATILARATNGVPRSAEKFVIAARDLDTQDATRILRFLNYTLDGLTTDHVHYMDLLCRNEVLGLDTISTYLQLSRQSVVLLEKLLVDKKLLTFSRTGRVATPLAHRLHKEKTHG